MQRTVLTVDSANGMSAVLDIEKWMFIPPELSVHILRPPVGQWLHLDAVTEVAPGWTGLTTGTLSDRHGPVARSAQSLFVARQPEAPPER
ncbi:thioesterase superfamily protein [Micromonospora sagamiensis]|uniref:Thioesterase superfamily protein n=1 Tax=Micromonospora sagamiensis TaxID=47875 RepID=A0A562WGX5_9ACTN|nr:acyl-CoA thioesterase domain-containing protein [Micromonospora sagamiensis]TWJ29435.1 thioesterase superfamily protein [Micromonospora sagamiensis]